MAHDTQYEALILKAVPSYRETGMIDIDHAAEAAGLGVFVQTFTDDVREASENDER
jgi:hypothetical protein